jgi:hypothetical protein
MIECIFSIDYEIYGDGHGSLLDLVYEPARVLKEVFDEAGAKLVIFAEAVELEKIKAAGSDPAIDAVESQIREFHQSGHEIALHLHPQWSNARWEHGRWILDYDEYNLCTLDKDRIETIVSDGISYLREVLGEPDFSPLSFRAGNWLFQPTEGAANVLASCGIKLDSSVFKGGLQRKHGLDYRHAPAGRSYWAFQRDVNEPDAGGSMIEAPIYTRMVPFWEMLTRKRVGLHRNGAGPKTVGGGHLKDLSRLLDFARLRYPLKFDFCRMTLDELVEMLECAERESDRAGDAFFPMVAIGHTKDLDDFDTVRAFLGILRDRNISVSSCRDVYPKCVGDKKALVVT